MDENTKTILDLINEFLSWDRSWKEFDLMETNMKDGGKLPSPPSDIEEFAKRLSSKYTINRK